GRDDWGDNNRDKCTCPTPHHNQHEGDEHPEAENREHHRSVLRFAIWVFTILLLTSLAVGSPAGRQRDTVDDAGDILEPLRRDGGVRSKTKRAAVHNTQKWSAS